MFIIVLYLILNLFQFMIHVPIRVNWWYYIWVILKQWRLKISQKPCPNLGKLMVLCMGSFKTLKAKNYSGNLFQFMTQKSCPNV